ncbi:MAG: AMP-binding protein, partial [Bacteroidota bacterium]
VKAKGMVSSVAEKLGEGGENFIILEESYIRESVDGAVGNKEETPLNFEVDITRDDLCYIMYTSGSTGKPKGVAISNENFMAFIDSIQLVYKMERTSRCMNTIPFHFDACMEDFYALYQGASLYITPSFTIPQLLVGIMMEKKITHVATTPSILMLIYDYVKKMGKDIKLTDLETIIMGGEVCDKKIINLLFDITENVEMINGYGPTEATCDAVTYTIREKSSTPGYFPIGQPLKHLEAALLTESGELSTEIHAKGELLLTGRQVFKGYIDREEETKKALKEINGKIYYHTGDLCLINEDGDYDFLGRKDEELKFRGFRVHLNEIKSVVTNIDFINSAEVYVLKEDDREGMFIAVAVMFNQGVPMERVKEITDEVKPYLTHYMIPSSYVVFDEFPMMPSSKFDRKKIKSYMTENDVVVEDKLYHFKDGKVTLIPN